MKKYINISSANYIICKIDLMLASEKKSLSKIILLQIIHNTYIYIYISLHNNWGKNKISLFSISNLLVFYFDCIIHFSSWYKIIRISFHLIFNIFTSIDCYVRFNIHLAWHLINRIRCWYNFKHCFQLMSPFFSNDLCHLTPTCCPISHSHRAKIASWKLLLKKLISSFIWFVIKYSISHTK